MDKQTSGDHYYYHRAERELEMAQRAERPEAVRAHHELANLYLDRFYGKSGGPETGV